MAQNRRGHSDPMLWIEFSESIRSRGFGENRNEMVVILMHYIKADAEAAAAKHKTVLSDWTTWFATIPLDIRRLILELVPCHSDACADQIICEHSNFTYNQEISCEVFPGTDLPESHVVPKLQCGERYIITCYSGSVLHSETRPAIIVIGTTYARISWYRNGISDCRHGYYSRHVYGPDFYYITDDPNFCELHETYDAELASHGGMPVRSHEEWLAAWQKISEADPWPVGDRYD